jgi:hypothetical protein
MDVTKCNSLKRKLASQEEPQLVSIEQFFDGNDDQGSIGCNLMDHPGVEAFRVALESLKARADVEAVYAQITELDPGADSWPFTDTVLVVGSISREELQETLAALEPDEVGPGTPDLLSPALSSADKSKALVAWWD